jgi:hypothetical protein
MQYVLDPEEKFVPFHLRSFMAEQIAGNRIVTSVHLSMVYARKSDPRWVHNMPITWALSVLPSAA